MAKCAYITLSLGWLYCPTGNVEHLQPHYELSNPKEHLVSPYNITPKSHIQVVRIKEMVSN